jgi:two-component system, sensor histidine kinase PdtaS
MTLNKMKNQIVFIMIFVLFGVFETSAQVPQWTLDSLVLYEEKLASHVSRDQLDEGKAVIAKIEEEGSNSLDPVFFDFFERAIENKSYQSQDALMAELHKSLGMLEYFRGNIRAALSAFNDARLYYIKSDEKKMAAGMAMNIGVMQEKIGQYDSAISNYKLAEPVFKELQDAKGLSNVYENLGLAYYQEDDFDLALRYFEQTDSLLNTYLDPNEIRWVGFYMNKHLLLFKMNRVEEGLKLLLKGFQIAEANKNDYYISKLGEMMGEVYELRGQTDKQYEALMKSKAFFKDSKNQQAVANLNYKLGVYHYQYGVMDSAMVYVEKSLAYFRENQMESSIGMVLNTMGNIAFMQEDYEKAIQYYQQTAAYYKNENTQAYAGFLFNMGYSLNKVGQSARALEYMERALAIRKPLKDLGGIRDAYQGIAEAQEGLREYAKAYEAFKLFHIYHDSVFNEVKSRQLAELETEYESGKKDQAIAVLESEKEIQALLSQKQKAQISLSIGGLILFLGLAGVFFRQAKIRKQHNHILALKNEEIAKQNDERELLLKEIHHRVKNNLQIISSLLSMQTRGLQDEKVKGAMKESQSRVKTMALIHEKLYQYENLSKINMQEYMIQLSDFLTQTYRSDKQINVIVEASEISLDMDMAIPIGLITNELLSNSLKYAFEDSDFGEIHIIFSEIDPGNYKLRVEDTGKGLDNDLDIEKSKSLGLKLVRTLTRQINGQLKISSNPGATFEIEFKEDALAA